MGTNRRYADAVDRQMNERVLQRITAEGPLQTLTSMELQLDRMPLTIDPQPRRRVRAWVRFGSTPVQVEAIAARWTEHAVGIEFEAGGRHHRCWVWASAVEEVAP